MEITLSLQQIAFWAAIVFTVIGAVMGLIGTWTKEFWRSETAFKLIITDLIFAITSAVVAAMAKLLS